MPSMLTTIDSTRSTAMLVARNNTIRFMCAVSPVMERCKLSYVGRTRWAGGTSVPSALRCARDLRFEPNRPSSELLATEWRARFYTRGKTAQAMPGSTALRSRLAQRVACADEQQRHGPEHRRHAKCGSQRAEKQRDRRLADVDQQRAHADGFGAAARRRLVIEQRHDHRLRATETRAQKKSERDQHGHGLDEREYEQRNASGNHRADQHLPLAHPVYHQR